MKNHHVKASKKPQHSKTATKSASKLTIENSSKSIAYDLSCELCNHEQTDHSIGGGLGGCVQCNCKMFLIRKIESQPVFSNHQPLNKLSHVNGQTSKVSEKDIRPTASNRYPTLLTIEKELLAAYERVCVLSTGTPWALESSYHMDIAVRLASIVALSNQIEDAIWRRRSTNLGSNTDVK